MSNNLPHAPANGWVWQAETQRKAYTTYERDANGGDEAMFRRYEKKTSRFAQPDPYDGSYSLANPQSLNRYAYVSNYPVNFVDPMGFIRTVCECRPLYLSHAPNYTQSKLFVLFPLTVLRASRYISSLIQFHATRWQSEQ